MSFIEGLWGFYQKTEKRAPHTYRFHQPAIKTEGRRVSFMGYHGYILLLCGIEAEEAERTPLLFAARPQQTMTEACGAQECPYCRHSRKSGLSVRLSVTLSLCQCVSIFMTDRTVGKVPLQTASIVYPPFISWRFIPLISDGENRR